jgi:crotonobetainyl-CoA:carnitine CoA-transferase CaiB-like acyl-CoA transferase
MADRAENNEACVAILDAAFARRPRPEWLALFREDASDLIYTIVNTVDDLPQDPQVLANDYVVEMDHPAHGPTQVVGIPVGLSMTPGSVREPAPELGQHTEDVLMNVLGWDWDRIGELREGEVI